MQSMTEQKKSEETIITVLLLLLVFITNIDDLLGIDSTYVVRMILALASIGLGLIAVVVLWYRRR